MQKTQQIQLKVLYNYYIKIVKDLQRGYEKNVYKDPVHKKYLENELTRESDSKNRNFIDPKDMSIMKNELQKQIDSKKKILEANIGQKIGAYETFYEDLKCEIWKNYISSKVRYTRKAHFYNQNKNDQLEIIKTQKHAKKGASFYNKLGKNNFK